MSSPAYDREYARTWRRSNPEAYRAYQERYRAENAERIREIRRKSAKKRRAELRALEDTMTTRICHSCRARLKYGHPAPSDNWAKISLSTRMFFILQQAAAEFDQLSEEAGEYPTASEFLDWLAPSIPGTAQHTAREKRPEAEGIAIVEGGMTKGNGHTRTTTTDPIPYAPLSKVMG